MHFEIGITLLLSLPCELVDTVQIVGIKLWEVRSVDGTLDIVNPSITWRASCSGDYRNGRYLRLVRSWTLLQLLVPLSGCYSLVNNNER